MQLFDPQWLSHDTRTVPRRVVTVSAWASAIAFFLTGLFPFFNADGYGHLAQGRQIAELGRVPRVDTFSFWRSTPQPWTNYEWGYDLGSWCIYDRFGANGLILIKCIGLSALGYVLVRLAVRLSQGVSIAAPIALTALLSLLPIARIRFTVRPQIIGLVFPAFLLAGISTLYSEVTSPRTKKLVLLTLLIMQLVWVNAHGSHLLGIAITVVFLAFSWRTSAFRWMMALLGAQLLATTVTPFGASIVRDALDHLVRPEFRSAVTEWAPWSPDDPLRLLLGPVVVSVLVLVTLRPVARSGRFGLGYGVFCVLLCFMGFRSTRFVAHQVLFSAPFIAAGLSHNAGVVKVGRGVWVAVVFAAVVCVIWTSRLVPSFGAGFGEARGDYPWGSALVIERDVADARVLATIQDSWPMVFAAPSARFLVDGRVPFYGPEFIMKVTQSFAQPDSFAQLLQEHDVNAIVIDHTRADHLPATELLLHDPMWNLVFVEDGHSLFVRDDATGTLESLLIVAPGFREGRLLDRDASDADVEAELDRLDPPEAEGALHGWLRGLQALRPVARDGARAGLRMSVTAEERDQTRRAYRLLTEAATVYPGFPSIERYRAMAASSACKTDAARNALARASVTGPSRDTVLAELELTLRGPDGSARDDSLSHLAKLRADPRTKNDPWVLAIAAEADANVRCR